MKRSSLKNRKTIEIYFILYLAAIILLIPGKEELEIENQKESNGYQSLPFELKPSKNVLNAYLIQDSLGIKILSIDSANTVFYTGDVENVSLEFNVTELSSNKEIKISQANPSTRLFKMHQQKVDKFATFVWMPSSNISKNTSYNVEVEGVAEMKNGEIVRNKVSFTLNAIFRNDLLIGEEDTNNIQIAAIDSPLISNYQFNPSVSNVIAFPSSDQIYEHPGNVWENKIQILGMNVLSQLRTDPIIRVYQNPENNQGSASISNFSENAITLKGITPSYGTIRVELELTRIDGSKTITEFKVEPLVYGNPQVPSEIYPEISYSFYSNVPFGSGLEIESLLLDSSGKTIKSSKGDSIKFVAKSNQSGAVLTFETYVNKKKVSSEKVEIKDYHTPVITKVQAIDSESVKVYTYSIGLYESLPNDVVELDIKGNADKIREIYGEFSTNEKTNSHVNIFILKKKKKNEKFEFSIKAINRAGKVSKQETFSS